MKELLVYARPFGSEINILVPKMRGTGYLKVPLGHHACPLSSLAYDIGFDLYGLEGSLDVQTGYYEEARCEELLAHIMPLLAKHYGMTWRLVDTDEYQANHPIKT